VKILLVDDHAIVRRGTRELLAEEFPRAEFEESATGEEAVARAERASFDLVVLDISMPRGGGMVALKEIVQRKPALAVLVLSQHEEDEYAIRALRAGAAGYITKQSAPEELVRAVGRALRGGKYVSTSLAEHFADRLARGGGQPLHQALSDRELQVLRMLALGKSVKDIAAELSLSKKTVSTYRTRLLEKLSLRTTAELMRYALRAGLVD
jgi:two-component system, NarL family, invasion response regulator UvrY